MYLCTCLHLDNTHLDERAFLGIKAKSRRGKNSLGPMMPNPFVRFVWSLEGKKTVIFLREIVYSFNIKFCYFEIYGGAYIHNTHIHKRYLQKKSFQICNGVWGQGLESKHRQHDAQPHWNIQKDLVSGLWRTSSSSSNSPSIPAQSFEAILSDVWKESWSYQIVT